MIKYFKLHPEVPGGLGQNTIYDKSILHWKLLHLHVVFDGWLGSDLLKISSCYLITDILKDQIIKEKLTGVLDFVDFEKDISTTFKNIYPNKVLPNFSWMQINGQVAIDDFAIDAKNKLIVSSNALSILNKVKLMDCEIEEYLL